MSTISIGEIENILFKCNQKAIVLKAINDSASNENGFPDVAAEDMSSLYSGMSLILSEIIDSISTALCLIQDNAADLSPKR